ncbi:hypothetical protein [Roseimaritima sediminicola]|uniref:hypothetical protein n=1 Tax=Roseimaritima sediminicola TaxID=2662066 RepID=UPI001F29B07E|nr:hypothetical protein [Roseimaritima sediminicola]
MHRSFAVVLGALALALVALRGGLRGEVAADVLREGLAAMMIFTAIGAVAGKIAEHLLQHTVETQFRDRVQWFQQERQKLETQNQTPDES